MQHSPIALPAPVQGQPAPGDGIPLHPRCPTDSNQRVSRGQRARSRHLLADPLVALQAYVRLRCCETHVALSHMVGPHRCVFVSRHRLRCLEASW